MPDTPFTVDEHDAIPLDRNTVPLPECKVVPVLQNGKVIKAVDVPILSCAAIWLRCQKEAEKWISDCNGKPLTDPILVNRRINAAYAYLWLVDSRFQWAGLAAFASKQVGCGLLHAAATVNKNRRERQRIEESFAVAAPPNPGLATMVPTGVATGSRHMEQQLALGNRTLFLDIYPLHRFYMLRGIEGLKKCLKDRQVIAAQVDWPAEVQDKLRFGQPFPEILTGFEAIERNDLMASVKKLAQHEQLNVLQKVIYDDLLTRAALDANQFAWVTGLPNGDHAEIQLTLSAQCSAKPTLTTWFKRSLFVHLYDEDDRMEFVNRAAAEFDNLLRKRRAEVEHSIREIYMGRGAR